MRHGLTEDGRISLPISSYLLTSALESVHLREQCLDLEKKSMVTSSLCTREKQVLACTDAVHNVYATPQKLNGMASHLEECKLVIID